ncbi:1433_t:CDS:2 [Cetraspora pellucida]|uniref:1433_t:CDS:1 n=1 Tax=Cetraspora pellucida TaxID=1433469 RepID=A0A9N9EQ70_9GLOM|nr:1433_t:CDS:2 [Cetraspora pellucida]
MDADEWMSSYASLHESCQNISSGQVAISPDGQRIVTFDPITSQVNIYDIEDLQTSIKSFEVEEDYFIRDNNHSINWSLAISDPIYSDINNNGINNDRLIAVSKFGPNDMIPLNKKEKYIPDHKQDIEKGKFEGKTWIISLKSQTTIRHSIGKIGGVVRFLDNKHYTLYEDSTTNNFNDNGITIVIVNATGLFKTILNYSDIIKVQRDSCWYNLFHSNTRIEEFYLPKHLSSDLSRLDKSEACCNLLHSSTIKNNLFVYSYKNKHQIIEMYSLKTGDMEMIFKKRELSHARTPKGRIIYAISQSEAFLAFCNGTNAITIYLMENGLEIITKRLLETSVMQRILSINFIENDSKLFITYEELCNSTINETKIVKSFIIWDLFTTSCNAIRKVEFTSDLMSQLDIDPIYRLLNFNGTILGAKNDKNFFWILQHPEVRKKLYPISEDLKTINLVDRKNEHISYNIVYDTNGDKIDTDLENYKVIIKNIEPWHNNKYYPRTSVYLDKAGHIQLIIGPDTIQVWRLKPTSTNKWNRSLEYAWVDEKIGLSIEKLKVKSREFLLDLTTEQGIYRICWPYNVNVLESACRFLSFIIDKKHEIKGNSNLNRYQELIESTQRLIYRFIKQHGIWRLTDIRYEIMIDLIKAQQYSLIKLILNENIDGKNCKLHLPRRYKGNMKPKKTTDLEFAIPDPMRRNKNSAIAIVGYLLEYYVDNAYYDMNSGWLFTVTKAIPLLYDNKLNGFVQNLFKKPCFGALEADTSSLNMTQYGRTTVSQNDQLDVKPLDFKPQLVRKPKSSLWTHFKEKIFSKWNTTVNSMIPNNSTIQNLNDKKVYMVPLPDFTVYPSNVNNHSQGFITTLWKFIKIMIYPRSRIITQKDYSPFLRVIDNEDDTKVYNCPSIIAATSFKWINARKYFLRYFVMYLVFVISFGVSAIDYTTHTIANSTVFISHKDTILIIADVISLYIGYYLFMSEMKQLKRETFGRYANIYNFFDLVSVILPISIVILRILKYNDKAMIQDGTFQIATAFTMLIMYFQLLLLLRYFKAPGHYIYIITNILNKIWPFFAFMLIVIFGFGHAMYILLGNPTVDPVKSQFSVDSYLIKNATNTSQILQPDIVIQHDVDPTSPSSNSFSTFITSVEAVFFWTNGRWDQLSNWNSTAVDVMSILGSLILVLIFQNLLISFMNGTFTQADMAGQNAARRYRAEMICDYETLEKPLGSKRGNPRYIYFIANNDAIDKWLNENKVYQQKCLPAHAESDDDLFNIKKRDISNGSSDSGGSLNMNGSHFLLDEENYKSKSTYILKTFDINGKKLKNTSIKFHSKENSYENLPSTDANYHIDMFSASRSNPQLPVLIEQNPTTNFDMSELLDKISKRLKTLEDGMGSKDKNKSKEFENRFKTMERNVNTILLKLNQLSI